VRDGFNFALLGIPAVALVTDQFWPQGDFVAESLGMQDLPRVKLPHPIAGTGTKNIEKIAQDMAASVIRALEARDD
jgi:hypothetical protein